MSSSSSTVQVLAGLLDECTDDPHLFNELWIADGRSFWWRQRELCEAIVDYRVVACYSGNMVGKDFTLGRVIWWWLYTRPGSLVIATGPSQSILGSVLWKEVRRATPRAIPPRARISRGVKTSPLTIDCGNGWQALGYSTTSLERASGQHAEELLVIVDEASGVEPEIWDAIESLGYTRLVAIGNPIRPDGRFVELIRQADKDARDGVPPHLAVKAIRIPSTDSPHADREKSDWGIADRTWLQSCYRRYGTDSLWVRSHIRAEIPELAAEVLVPEAWLDWAAAQARPAVPANHPIHQTRRLSCDLSEGVGRDSTCVLVRDDWGILEVVVSATVGLPEAASLMWRLGRKWDIPPGRMSYDVLGIGRSMRNHLARHGLEGAIPYAGESSSLDPSFTNLRTEAAWRLRNRLDPNFVADTRAPHANRQPYVIPTHPWYSRLREEMKPLSYSLIGSKTRLLPKKDWVDQLGSSPDIADAWIQSHSF